MLNSVDAQSSEDELCIEKYLIKSEKQWFVRFQRAKLGMSAPVAGSSSSVFRLPWGGNEDEGSSDESDYSREGSVSDEFVMRDDYVSPTGLRKLLQRKIGDWQRYCFLLAFVQEIPHSPTIDAPADVRQGQIIAANSYQITLLTGEDGQAAVKLYIVAIIYLVASLFWWFLSYSMVLRFSSSGWPLTPRVFGQEAGYIILPRASTLSHPPAGRSSFRLILELKVRSQDPKCGLFLHAGSFPDLRRRYSSLKT
jgi:hypothetical protein